MGGDRMSVRIRRVDDHSDEGYIRVVLDTPAKAKAEIICRAYVPTEDLDLSPRDGMAVDHLIYGLQYYLAFQQEKQS